MDLLEHNVKGNVKLIAMIYSLESFELSVHIRPMERGSHPKAKVPETSRIVLIARKSCWFICPG